MPILSLKNVLLCRLEQALLGNHSEKSDGFINFLYDKKGQPHFSEKPALTKGISWQKISLQKKQKVANLAYISALPQIVAGHQDCSHASTLAEISERMVNRLKQAQLEALNSDSDHQKYGATLCSYFWAEFKIETHRPGWIELSLSNKGIERWIQHIQKKNQPYGLYSPCLLNQDCLSFAKHRLLKLFKTVDRDHSTLKVEKLSHNCHEKLSSSRAKHNSINISQSAHHTLTEKGLEVPIKDKYPQPNSPSNLNIPSLGQSSGHVSIDTGTPRTVESCRFLSSPSELSQLSESAEQQRRQLSPYQTLKPSQHQAADALLWQVQYTYARCCCLMRLWQAAARPEKREPQGGHARIQLSAGCTDELVDNRLSGGLPNSPQAQQLIQALIETADDMFWIPYRWPSRQYFLLLRASSQLCQSFEAFYGTCLSGFSQISLAADDVQKRHYFQAQFGLVVATKQMLKALLQAYLEADAPTEL